MTTTSSRPALLYVDDEPTARDLAARILAKAGFDVVAASNGVEAMKSLRARPDIRALISDIRMPKLNGVQLATMAQDCNPNIRVALVTAYIDEANGLLDSIQWPVWMKPLDIDQLPLLAKELCSRQ